MPFNEFEIHALDIDQEELNDTSSLTPINYFGNNEADSVLQALIIATDETLAIEIAVWSAFANSPVSLLGTFTIPAGSGFDGTAPAVDLVPLLFPNLLLLNIKRNYGVAIAPVAAISSGKHVWVTSLGGRY